MLSIGIDSGSAAVKGALMNGECVLDIVSEPATANPAGQCERLVSKLKTPFTGSETIPVCATGYGRDLVKEAESSVSEIFANALGAGWAWRNWDKMPLIGRAFSQGAPHPLKPPDKFKTIIDIGGQDSKVVTFGQDGVVEGFAMNDRCAAGTGRFLQELSEVLDVDGLGKIDELALQCKASCRISSTCTVFAESEIVSMISDGVPRSKIASGIFNSAADRASELAESLNWHGPVLFDGGAAKLKALHAALQARLQTPLAVPACPQHIIAIGAALFASGNYG